MDRALDTRLMGGPQRRKNRNILIPAEGPEKKNPPPPGVLVEKGEEFLVKFLLCPGPDLKPHWRSEVG
jgi:hypothetical protein